MTSPLKNVLKKAPADYMSERDLAKFLLVKLNDLGWGFILKDKLLRITKTVGGNVESHQYHWADVLRRRLQTSRKKV